MDNSAADLSQNTRIEAINKINRRLWRAEISPDGFCAGDSLVWSLAMYDKFVNKDDKRLKELEEIAQMLATKEFDWQQLENQHDLYMSMKNSQNLASTPAIPDEVIADHKTYLKLLKYYNNIMFGQMGQDIAKDIAFQDAWDKKINLAENIDPASPDAFVKEAGMIFVTERDKVISALKEIIIKNKIINFSKDKHSMALFYDGQQYHFYDPNSSIGVVTKTKFEDMEKEIHSALEYQASEKRYYKINIFDIKKNVIKSTLLEKEQRQKLFGYSITDKELNKPFEENNTIIELAISRNDNVLTADAIDHTKANGIKTDDKLILATAIGIANKEILAILNEKKIFPHYGPEDDIILTKMMTLLIQSDCISYFNDWLNTFDDPNLKSQILMAAFPSIFQIKKNTPQKAEMVSYFCAEYQKYTGRTILSDVISNLPNLRVFVPDENGIVHTFTQPNLRRLTEEKLISLLLLAQYTKENIDLDTMSDYQGNMSLHKIAMLGEANEFMQHFLMHPHMIEVENQNKKTPIHILISSGNIEILSNIIDKKLIDFTPYFNNPKAIFQAIESTNRMEMLALFCKNGAKINEALDKEKNNLLHDAARIGDFEVFKYCLDQGLDPQAKNGDGDTPLEVAVKHHNLPLIKYLIETNTYAIEKNETILLTALTAKDPKGQTGTVTSNIEMTRYLLEQFSDISCYAKNSALLDAVLSSDFIEYKTTDLFEKIVFKQGMGLKGLEMPDSDNVCVLEKIIADKKHLRLLNNEIIIGEVLGSCSAIDLKAIIASAREGGAGYLLKKSILNELKKYYPKDLIFKASEDLFHRTFYSANNTEFLLAFMNNDVNFPYMLLTEQKYSINLVAILEALIDDSRFDINKCQPADIDSFIRQCAEKNKLNLLKKIINKLGKTEQLQLLDRFKYSDDLFVVIENLIDDSRFDINKCPPADIDSFIRQCAEKNKLNLLKKIINKLGKTEQLQLVERLEYSDIKPIVTNVLTEIGVIIPQIPHHAAPLLFSPQPRRPTIPFDFRLHQAAQNNDLATMAWLLKNGVDINITDPNNGKTPLMIAVEKEHMPAAQMLLHYGADITRVDIEGNNFLHLNLISDLIPLGISKGIAIDSRNNQGQTPLLRMIETGWFSLALNLIKYGASLNINQEGYAYMEILLNYSPSEERTALIQHGFKLGYPVNRTPNEQTPPLLFIALMRFDKSMVDLMMTYQADLNQIVSGSNGMSVAELWLNNINSHVPLDEAPEEKFFLQYTLQTYGHKLSTKIKDACLKIPNDFIKNSLQAKEPVAEPSQKPTNKF